MFRAGRSAGSPCSQNLEMARRWRVSGPPEGAPPGKVMNPSMRALWEQGLEKDWVAQLGTGVLMLDLLQNLQQVILKQWASMKGTRGHGGATIETVAIEWGH